MGSEQVRVERQTLETAALKEIVEEYYRAVDVMVKDTAGALGRMMVEPGGGVWLAWAGECAVGCVALRRMNGEASECKRLYVRPEARGLGVATLLMDAVEDFAREQGVGWVYLDSHDGLRAALALYRARGYAECARYNENPQATVFMRKAV